MAVGGLAITPKRAAEIGREMQRLREARNVAPQSEVKWKKAKSKRTICEDYINLLFDLIDRNHAHLHIRFSPFQEYDHRASGDRRETDTISKAYYQLLFHRAGRLYGEKAKLLIRPDGGTCTSYLPKMIGGLNADIGMRYNIRHQSIAEIAPRDSHQEPMLQLLDVTLGALTAARNGSHLTDEMSAIKRDLIGLVMERAKVKSLEISHPKEHKRFNLWNTTPKWAKSAVPKR